MARVKAWVGWVVAGVVAIGAAAGCDGADSTGRDGSAGAGARATTEAAGAGEAPEGHQAAPAAQAAAKPRPRPRTYRVASVTDGDTLRLANGEAVRLVGIDAPEQGRCGSVRATDLLTRLVEGRRVTLKAPVDDRDRYGRLLRYVNLGTMDAGLRMIKNGLAVARYDSRDGYDAHPREALYHRIDDAVPNVTCAPPAPLAGGGGSACASGYSPCIPSYPPDLDCADVGGPIQVTGSDPHGLDADGDGVACET
jgi:endonuclease YncB( thermonuclease family)